jgi:deferrochelatase/peroxidase EfeB
VSRAVAVRPCDVLVLQFVEAADEGLEFFAFSRDYNIIDAALRSMAGQLPGTETDRLMAFSVGVACGMFFMPSRTQLAKL